MPPWLSVANWKIPPDGRPENGFDSEGELSIRAFSEVSGDMLLESPALGSKALDSFRNWASTRSVRDPSTFEKFEDYILHRVEHVGVE